MIQHFSNTDTEQLFSTGKSRRLPTDILRRAIMRLTQLDAATSVDDLRLPSSNRLETLTGSGDYVLDLSMVMRLMLKLSIITKEYHHANQWFATYPTL